MFFVIFTPNEKHMKTNLYLEILELTLKDDPNSREADEIMSILKRRHGSAEVNKKISELKDKYRTSTPTPKPNKGFKGLKVWEPGKTETELVEAEKKSQKTFTEQSKDNSPAPQQSTQTNKVVAGSGVDMDIAPTILYDRHTKDNDPLKKFFKGKTENVFAYAEEYGIKLPGTIKNIGTAITHLMHKCVEMGIVELGEEE